jgi:hypothetical protein
MRPAHRIVAMRRISSALADYPETEVDDLLRASGSRAFTSAGWGGLPREERVQELSRVVSNSSDETLELLTEACDEMADLFPKEEAGTIATANSPVEESRASAALEQCQPKQRRRFKKKFPFLRRTLRDPSSWFMDMRRRCCTRRFGY